MDSGIESPGRGSEHTRPLHVLVISLQSTFRIDREAAEYSAASTEWDDRDHCAVLNVSSFAKRYAIQQAFPML